MNIPLSVPVSSIIDHDELVERMMGNAEMARRMLGRFVESSNIECDLMESTVRLGDKNAIASIAHRHKGTAKTMAAGRIARLAGELEQRAHRDEISHLLQLVDQMRQLHQEVQQVLEDGFSDGGTETGT